MGKLVFSPPMLCYDKLKITELMSSFSILLLFLHGERAMLGVCHIRFFLRRLREGMVLYAAPDTTGRSHS